MIDADVSLQAPDQNMRLCRVSVEGGLSSCDIGCTANGYVTALDF